MRLCFSFFSTNIHYYFVECFWVQTKRSIDVLQCIQYIYIHMHMKLGRKQRKSEKKTYLFRKSDIFTFGNVPRREAGGAGDAEGGQHCHCDSCEPHMDHWRASSEDPDVLLSLSGMSDFQCGASWEPRMPLGASNEVQLPTYVSNKVYFAEETP